MHTVERYGVLTCLHTVERYGVLTCLHTVERYGVLTCLHTVERYGVLSDELIPDEVVIQNREPDQSQLRKVDLELETLVKYRIVTYKVERKTVVIYGWTVL